MIIRFYCLLFFSIFFAIPGYGQVAPSIVSDSTKTDSVNASREVYYWKEKNSLGVNINEVAFVNWNAGGDNSIAALFQGDFERNFKRKLTNWKNSLSMRYGINSQEGQAVRKTEDVLEVTSSFGYRKDSTSNWYYSGRFDFNTQFSNGYQYPDKDVAISKFMAPGYLFLGVGTEYSDPDEDFSVYISPLTEKSTFVLDQRLANEGMFGVDPAVYDELGNQIQEGERTRTEFGFLISSDFSKEVFTNIFMVNKIQFYSDYLNKFGNIDVDWELNVKLKVNDFVKANIGSHLLYDDDVKYKEDTNDDGNLETFGPKIQWKQLLGVGVVYEF